MSNLIYHRSEPESKKDSYLQFDSLDFNINVGEDRVLVKNSVRLLGDLKVLDNGAVPGAAVDIGFDPRCGMHSFFESVQVSFLDGPNPGQKENLQNYARYVYMQESATKAPEDMLNASNVVELKADDLKSTILYSKGRLTRNTGGGATVQSDQDFAMKPVCVLNKMSGGDLPMSKSGIIRLTMNLAPNHSALCGIDLNNAQDTYSISNVRVVYQSLPATGKEQQSVMRSVYNVKSTIQSNFANVQARVPAVASSVSVSFQRQDREQISPFSNYIMNKPPQVSDIQFLFNDSTNEYISYKIDDKTEMQQRYIDSFTDTGHNTVAIDRYNSNQNFGMGLAFGGFVDLSNQKFALQINSKINNTQPYNCYMYFHSVVGL